MRLLTIRPEVRQILESFVLTLFDRLPDNWFRHLLFLLRGKPQLTDRWGYHIRPIHFYEPLPDFQSLTNSRFLAERSRPGIDFRFPEQITLFERLSRFREELASLSTATGQDGFDFCNDYFSGLDACLYYALIRDLKPARIIEVGAGYSTQIAAKALSKNYESGVHGQLFAIEPYPEPRLMQIRSDFELIQSPVEAIDASLFGQLAHNDILFIDSSHAASFGSDVCKLVLEIIPGLNAGVWVHVHDIFFPGDYPREWLLDKRLAFNEQYLLEAFLNFNQKYVICAMNHWLALKHETLLEKLCPPATLLGTHPGNASFWMRRIDE